MEARLKMYSTQPKTAMSCEWEFLSFFYQRDEVRGFLCLGVDDRANQPRLNSQLPQ
jgi:hypothetical protein